MAFVPPKPTVSASGVLVAGQRLTVGATSTAFSSFNANTNLVLIEVQSANVIATFDGVAPSASYGHTLYAAKPYHWHVDTAHAAKFIQASSTAYIMCSEFMSAKGADTKLTDTAVQKTSNA